MVDTAFAAVNIEKPARNRQRVGFAFFIDRFFKAAFTAAVTEGFPVTVGAGFCFL